MIRKLLALAVLCAFFVYSFFQFYHFLKKRVAVSDLKAVTEKRISAFLKVPVHVDKINVGLLRHISLSGLEIARTQKKYPLLIGARKIVVRYDLISFLKRNFRVPAEIFLEAPRLAFQAFQSPETFFDFNLLKSEHGIVTRFEFEEGEIQLPWFRSYEKLGLVGIEGLAVPKKDSLFDLRFKARVAGAARGSVLAYGEMDPSKRTYQLEITLDDISFIDTSQLPVAHLRGIIGLENDKIHIRKLEFLFRGIPCELSGNIQDAFSTKPMYELSVTIKEGKFPVRSDIRADFKSQTVASTIRFADRQFKLNGLLVGEPLDFQIPGMTINDLYQASAEFDIEKGIYRLKAEREGERFRFDFSMADFAWQFIFKLDHFKIFGFDLVTYATVGLKPHEESWQKGTHAFVAHLETDYLIFQHEPLRDFKAEARISAKGVDDILAHWGTRSELRGAISFGPNPEANLNLGIGAISLSEFDSLGIHPLPVSLGGLFEGKLDIRGPLDMPILNGTFSIEKGTIGSLKYDRAIMNFSGKLPYLTLKDSKVLKGKNNFALKGGLDFARRNFLEAVQVDTPEHTVIWKGLELSGEIQNSKRGTDLSRLEADYILGERTSLHVTAEEDQTKREYLSVGPKVKF
ncbi:MAG: hypothetical protein HY585_04445 [Candidatus Omnitrophica bacterium]|nr:hypothetical protein [Candidatus Omnitrophota bacterium]